MNKNKIAYLFLIIALAIAVYLFFLKQQSKQAAIIKDQKNAIDMKTTNTNNIPTTTANIAPVDFSKKSTTFLDTMSVQKKPIKTNKAEIISISEKLKTPKTRKNLTKEEKIKLYLLKEQYNLHQTLKTKKYFDSFKKMSEAESKKNLENFKNKSGINFDLPADFKVKHESLGPGIEYMVSQSPNRGVFLKVVKKDGLVSQQDMDYAYGNIASFKMKDYALTDFKVQTTYETTKIYRASDNGYTSYIALLQNKNESVAVVYEGSPTQAFANRTAAAEFLKSIIKKPTKPN